MKITTVLLIGLFIFLLYYYTAETYDVVRVVGKHAYQFFDGVFSDIAEQNEKGTYDAVKEDVQNVVS